MTEDNLAKLRAAVRQKRDLDIQIHEIEDRLSAHKQQRYELEHTTLPDMFMAARITALTLEPEGNLPPYRAKLAPYYKAVISADWPPEQQQAAFELLEKLKMSDIIRTIIEVHFGKGEGKATKAFLSAIRKLVRPDQINQRRGVPWSTLTAAIRYYYEGQHKQLSDVELITLGATVGYAVTLKEELKDGQ